jgi:hypothetical protein
MGIHTVRSVLLLSAYFLSVNEVRMCAGHHICWKYVCSSRHLTVLTFLKAHSHSWYYAVRVVVHLEDLLLLSGQVLWLVLSIHHCETH